MRAFARTAAVVLVAFGVSLPLASIASGASGEPTAKSASTRESSKAAHPKSKGHTKTKKKRKAHHPRHAGTPRGAVRLSFAATGDGPLVDESALPPPRDGVCPPEMASIEGRYCVDKWEASLVEMAAGGDSIFPFTSTVDGRAVRAVSVPGAFPQGYISGVEAAQACANAGKRLCSWCRGR
jgi:hypothetical protein